MMVLWHSSAMVCDMLSITPVMTDGLVEVDPLYGLRARLT